MPTTQTNFSAALTALEAGTEQTRAAWSNQFLHYVNAEIGVLLIRKMPTGQVMLGSYAANSADLLATDWQARTVAEAAPASAPAAS